MLTRESATRKDRTTGQSAELQHRHFAFIAAVIKDAPASSSEVEFWGKYFADACAGSNPRFDRRRFLAACGVEE